MERRCLKNQLPLHVLIGDQRSKRASPLALPREAEEGFLKEMITKVNFKLSRILPSRWGGKGHFEQEEVAGQVYGTKSEFCVLNSKPWCGLDRKL